MEEKNNTVESSKDNTKADVAPVMDKEISVSNSNIQPKTIIVFEIYHEASQSYLAVFGNDIDDEINQIREQYDGSYFR